MPNAVTGTVNEAVNGAVNGAVRETVREAMTEAMKAATEIVVHRRAARNPQARRWRWLLAPAYWLLSAGAAAQAPEEASAEPAASSTAPVVVRERLTVATGLGQSALAERYPQAAVWLENSDGGSELALLEPAHQPQAEGAVLLLAGEGLSGGGGFEGAVRQLLAERGWAAMTLGLPLAPLTERLARPVREVPESEPEPEPEPEHEPEPEPEQEPEKGAAAADVPAVPQQSVMIDVMAAPAPEQRLEHYRERVRSTLAAAQAELHARGHQRVVLMGVGQAAEPVMQAALASGEPGELVWIAPRFPVATETDWPGRLAGLERWPVLDLTSSLNDLAAARARAAAFRRQGLVGYQQQVSVLALPLTARDAPRLVNRVVAWLGRAGSY
ncbi:DUF3530 family protein [Marinobacter sp. SS21]|uniref:DUF3530 family protein n=1 Tax=Marinobacter sp. SS21 TaxID=2979460 RepID=UPI002330C843|nr:DUF3530 family protein [Marinobacter sp. SS21]MDC0662315.1 DUF3530 family protein [Marinobacter sp. SS21]